MRKHGGTPSRRDKQVTLAAISPPGDARGRFVGGQQSGLAGCKPPPLFTRAASSCSSQGRRQGEPRGVGQDANAINWLIRPLLGLEHDPHGHRLNPTDEGFITSGLGLRPIHQESLGTPRLTRGGH